MRVDREAGPDQGVFRYAVEPKKTGGKGKITDVDVARADAEGVAAWIQGLVASGKQVHGDFLILVYRKDYLGHYARALEARNIPAEVTGGKLLVQESITRTSAKSESEAQQADLFFVDGFAIGFPEFAPTDSVPASPNGPQLGINGEPLEIVEGVIDLAFREPAGWVIADYKTDIVEEDETTLGARRELYRAQVALYADCWERLTGEPVLERALLFTSTGRTESWRDDCR